MSWEYSLYKDRMLFCSHHKVLPGGQRKQTALVSCLFYLDRFPLTLQFTSPGLLWGPPIHAMLRLFSLDPWTILLEKQTATLVHIRTTWGTFENPNA